MPSGESPFSGSVPTTFKGQRKEDIISSSCTSRAAAALTCYGGYSGTAILIIRYGALAGRGSSTTTASPAAALALETSPSVETAATGPSGIIEA